MPMAASINARPASAPISMATALDRWRPATRSVDDRQFGEIRRGVIRDAQHDERAIVAGRQAIAVAAMLRSSRKDTLGDFAGGVVWRNTREHFPQAVAAELFFLCIFRFEDAIGGEEDHITGHQLKSEFVISDIGE